MRSRIWRCGWAARIGKGLVALAASLIGFVGTGPSARAGTIRHDVPDSQYTDLAAQPEYAAVGEIPLNGLTTGGTLISSRWVLTAAHVVSGTQTFTVDGVTYNVVQSVVNPGYDADGMPDPGIDLALMRLSAPVTSVAPAVRYAGAATLTGSIGAIVGFGRTGTGLTGASILTDDRRAGTNVLDVLGGAAGVPNISTNYILADFDNPLNAADSKWGSSTPLPLEYMLATGDSGGAVFVDVGGIARLVGVSSFIGAFDSSANSDYGDFMAFMRVSVANDWIDDTIAVKWNNASGGSAHTAANWQIGNAPSTLLPDSTDILGFNIAGTYTVNFTGANTYNKILVRQGTVTLNLGSATQAVNSPMQNGSVTVGRNSGDLAQLTLTGGTLSATDAFVGRSSGSTGIVVLSGSGTQWNLSESLYLGGSNISSGGNGTLTVNAGTSVQVAGTLKLWSNATLNLNGGAVTAGTLNLSGGQIAGAGGSLTAGSIEGAGTINVNVQASGSVSPGNSVGHLTFGQNLVLQSGASLVIELGGLDPGVNHDLVTVGGGLQVGGLLQLSFINGFESSIGAGDLITIVNGTSAITGVFANALNNARVVTTDHLGSFIVHYGAGSSFAPDDLVLTNFLPFIPGDFDLDGDVDGADFVIWQTNFPTQSGATLAMGDADGDGDVDGADFVVWQTNFPTTASQGIALAAVPEPASWLLGAISLAAFASVLLTLRREDSSRRSVKSTLRIRHP